ncbi:MAG: hypothetical protein IJZ00_02745 [Lachnospiraceae bacterium]|nr:hypothetical protein [Lachnospiraceae bacterium]
MSNLSEKELASLGELLSGEELLVKKFKMLAENATDENVKCEMERISARHQDHFNQLYNHLS